MDSLIRQMSDEKEKAWLSLTEVMDRTSWTRGQINRLIQRQHLTIRKIPGLRPTISLASLERLLEQSVKPAVIS